MKKRWMFVVSAFAIVLAMSSCKSKETAYKAAYEKAQEKPIATNETQTIAPKPATSENTSAYSGRETTEKITAVNPNDASGLKMYNVVIGSFRNKTNASALKERMVSEGYNVILAQNAEGMLRVIVGSYDTRNEAVNARESVKSKYPNNFNDAWLLINR